MARGLPQLGRRRGARAGVHERRLAEDQGRDARARRSAGRPGHPCHVPGRLRHTRPVLVGLRPRGLRPHRPGRPGVRPVLLDERRGVPRRRRKVRPGRRPLRDPEHQPPAGGHPGRQPLPGSHRGQERLHHRGGQHPDRRGAPGRPHADRDRDEPSGGHRLRQCPLASRLGLLRGRQGAAGRLAPAPVARTSTTSAAGPAQTPADAALMATHHSTTRKASVLGGFAAVGALLASLSASLWLLRRRRRR